MSLTLEIDDRISKCQKILDQDPNSQIFAALAEALRKKGDLDKAFRVCQNGLRIHPSYGSAHLVMAKINLDRNLFDWAETEVNKAIELEGSNRATELLLAEIFIYKNEHKSAIKLLKQLLQSDPNNSQIKKLLEIAQRIPEEQNRIAKPEPVQEQPTTVEQSQKITQPESEQEKVSFLNKNEIIYEALKINEINGVQFLNNEGLIVESEWALDLDPNLCGATLSDLDHILTQDLIEAEFGKTHSLLIENNEAIFYLIHVSDGIFLFAGSSKLNLGKLRMKISSLICRYKEDSKE